MFTNLRWMVTMTGIMLWARLVQADPILIKTDLFEAGKEGYALYRIPGIVATPKGTVLAYCEARKHAGGDWGHIDIMLRRSTDAGKTWEERRSIATIPGMVPRNSAAIKQKLGKEGERTINNPVAIVDQKMGAVHFLYCVEYARCYYMRSDDEGKTFSKPVDITGTFEKFRKDYNWQVLATGPGHGIQLRNGRLLVPVWLSTGTGGHSHRPSCISVIYSDDSGQSWRRGEIIAADPNPANPSESMAVELADGPVLLNIRNETKPHFRGYSLSPDGVKNWAPFKIDKQLPEPICMASMVRLSQEKVHKKNRILFANPNNPLNRERKNLTIRLSYDEAQTWPVARALEPGPSGYSDLAVTSAGEILCFYERGSTEKSAFRPAYLTLARFNLDWLSEGKDRWMVP